MLEFACVSVFCRADALTWLGARWLFRLCWNACLWYVASGHVPCSQGLMPMLLLSSRTLPTLLMALMGWLVDGLCSGPL